MRCGVRLGVDIGAVRVGVAVSDPSGLMATPVETVPRDPAGAGDLERIAAIAAEHHAVEIVVGLPTSLAGRDGPAAKDARAYANALATRLVPVQVRLVDERLTTVSAIRELRRAGVRAKKGRSVVDQAAASIILQSALDMERGTGEPAGTLVCP